MSNRASPRTKAPVWLRRPRTIVICWVTIALAIGFIGQAIGAQSFVPGPSSARALEANPGERRASAAGIPRKDTLLALLEHPDYVVATPEFNQARDDLFALLRDFRSPGGDRVFSHVETAGHSDYPDKTFVSADAKHLLLRATSTATVDRVDRDLVALPAALERWRRDSAGFELRYLSEGIANKEMFALIDSDLDRSLIVTLPLTCIVLLWVFGSITAAAVPLLVALLSLAASLGAAAIISHVLAPICATAEQLVVLLVLAVGIDYSLFMLSRIREERRHGADIATAIMCARETAGLAVLWSGITVALSLVGLLFMEDTVLTSMALVSICAVILTVAGTLLALPALFVLLGDRLGASDVTKARRSGLIDASMRHPVLALVVAGAALLLLGSRAGDLRLGTTVEPSMFPPTLQTHDAWERISTHFPLLAGTDLSVVTPTPELPNALRSEESLATPVAVEVSRPGTARFHYVVRGSSNDDSNRDLVRRLEKALDSSGGTDRSYLGGTLPFVVADVARYRDRGALAIAAVLVLCFVLLLLAFRSIVVPAKALILNLLSTAASFGALVLVFQDGLTGAWHYGVIESFVPSLLFSILFGLSMDYHVFLLSRIREEVIRGAETSEAVSRGIHEAFSVITGAAAIMVCVFTVIASLQLPIMKELGVGLAVAIFVDATIVRSILLPASMVLLGRWNWYLPSWLSWLPSIDLERSLPRSEPRMVMNGMKTLRNT